MCLLYGAVAFEGGEGVDAVEEPAFLADNDRTAGDVEEGVVDFTGSAEFEFQGVVEFEPRTGRGIIAKCVCHSLTLRSSPPH